MNAQSHSALDNLRSLSFWDGWGCTITVLLLLPWLTPTPFKPRVIKRDGMRESAIKLSMEKAALQWRANNTKNRSFYLKVQPVLNSRVSNISTFGKAALTNTQKAAFKVSDTLGLYRWWDGCRYALERRGMKQDEKHGWMRGRQCEVGV